MPKEAPSLVISTTGNGQRPTANGQPAAVAAANTAGAVSGALACLSPQRSSRAPLFGIILHAPLTQQG